MKNKVIDLIKVLYDISRKPRKSYKLLKGLSSYVRGDEYGENWNLSSKNFLKSDLTYPSNPLRSLFDSNQAGPGIWKWLHYFDIYHNHFKDFINREVNVLEIGIYSGGSLKMWKDYFGPNCRVYGVDIEEACKIYENDSTKIFIGDQGDRSFWKSFKKQVPAIDIIIDDGGHTTEQQIITLEEMLPHLRPGGIYLCEDVQGNLNQFNYYVQGLMAHLNSWIWKSDDRDVGISTHTTPFQAAVHSIHLYPFVTVIEKTINSVNELTAPKHGTEWQPHL